MSGPKNLSVTVLGISKTTERFFAPLRMTNKSLPTRQFRFQQKGRCLYLINIVLLPMQRRIRLNDDGLARGVLEIFDQGGLARLQGLGDFRVDAADVKVFLNRLNFRVEYPSLSLGRNHVSRSGVGVVYNSLMAKNVIHISETEAAKTNVEELLVHVRAGAEVVIENGARPVAVLRSAESHPGRLLSESVALAEAHGSTVTLDGDFGRDLEAIVHSHLEPLNPPAWD